MMLLVPFKPYRIRKHDLAWQVPQAPVDTFDSIEVCKSPKRPLGLAGFVGINGSAGIGNTIGPFEIRQLPKRLGSSAVPLVLGDTFSAIEAIRFPKTPSRFASSASIWRHRQFFQSL
jgi:hypothetical protein